MARKGVVKKRRGEEDAVDVMTVRRRLWQK